MVESARPDLGPVKRASANRLRSNPPNPVPVRSRLSGWVRSVQYLVRSRLSGRVRSAGTRSPSSRPNLVRLTPGRLTPSQSGKPPDSATSAASGACANPTLAPGRANAFGCATYIATCAIVADPLVARSVVRLRSPQPKSPGVSPLARTSTAYPSAAVNARGGARQVGGSMIAPRIERRSRSLGPPPIVRCPVPSGRPPMRRPTFPFPSWDPVLPTDSTVPGARAPARSGRSPPSETPPPHGSQSARRATFLQPQGIRSTPPRCRAHSPPITPDSAAPPVDHDPPRKAPGPDPPVDNSWVGAGAPTQEVVQRNAAMVALVSFRTRALSLLSAVPMATPS